MPSYFLITSTLDTPTSGSLWKKKLITNYPFLDVLVNAVALVSVQQYFVIELPVFRSDKCHMLFKGYVFHCSRQGCTSVDLGGSIQH